MECPICYDTLTQVNCITTSCGHAFHANCLMKHTAHNGYTCPCCREQMIEEPAEDNESDDEDEDSLFDDEDEDDYFYEDTITSEEREEEALQSFRWFQQRLAQAELEEDVEGYTDDGLSEDASSMEQAYNKNKRKIEILTERIKKIDKLPYDKLLAAFMSCCSDYTCNMYSNEMFKQVSSMVDDVHERIVNEGGYNEAAVVVPSN